MSMIQPSISPFSSPFSVHFGARRRKGEEYSKNELINDLANFYDGEYLDKLYPAVEQTYKFFGIEGHRGIPPAIGKKSPDNPFRTKNTHGVIVRIFSEILNRLPLAKTRKEAIHQIKKSMDAVSKRAIEQNRKKTLPADVTTTMGVAYEASAPLRAFKHPRVKGVMYVSNLLFTSPNGAVQVAALPTAEEMIRMLARDRSMRQKVDQIRPLSKILPLDLASDNPGPLKKKDANYNGTMTHLQKLAKGELKKRVYDLHVLTSLLPFDFKNHIESGDLRLIVDKPGRDGRRVWDV